MSRHRSEVKPKIKINKKLYAVVGALAALSMGLTATHAAFSDSGTSNITATAGKIEMFLGASGTSKTATIALGSSLYPGGTIPNQTLVVRNTGTMAMKYTGAVTGTPGPLANNLTVVIKNGTTTLYSGKMNAMAISSQSIPAGGSHTLTMTFTFPNGTPANDNPLMGLSANTNLTLSGTN